MTDAVAADVAADTKGEPRPTTATPPPPGTVVETFWQRTGTLVAIAMSITFGLHIVSPYAVSLFGAEGAVLFESMVWGWSAAFGVSRVSPGLRAK